MNSKAAETTSQEYSYFIETFGKPCNQVEVVNDLVVK